MYISHALKSEHANNIEVSSLYLLITEVEQTVTTHTPLSTLQSAYEPVPAQVFIL